MGKSNHVRTNFGQYSHQQLYAMLYAGNPDSARNAAATWNDTGNALHDQANQLAKQLGGFSQEWQGGAANQYQTMMNDLIGGIRKVADTAYRMRDLNYDVADAQDTARAEMPAPVDVPAVSPATVALASAPIQVDAGTPAAVVAQIQRARASAIAAVQGQQQAAAAADAASAKAIQVMTTLADAYVAAQDSIPPAPDAEVAPNLPAGGAIGLGADAAAPTGMGAMLLSAPVTADQAWSLSGDLNAAPDPTTGDPTSGLTMAPDPLTQQDNPLFGGMFGAGVAAASAAVFGRFGSLIPKVPGFASRTGKGGTATTTDNSTGTTDPPKLGDRLAAAGGGGTKIGGAGGVGGLKGGGVGVGGVGGAAAPTPSASPAALGAGNVGGDVAAGAVGAAGVAARGAAGVPMMPMMPMGGMMGGDMGGGRRVPPWLVETEDVWGESSAVAPTVIGEEP